MKTLQKLLALLSPTERRRLALLVPVTITMALAEVAGIASIAPFLSLVADSTAATSQPLLRWVFEAFGFERVESFIVAVGIAVIVVLLVSNGLLAMGYWALFRYGALRGHSIALRLLTAYLSQPYVFFLRHNTGTLASNVLQQVQSVATGLLIPLLMVVAKAFAVLAIVALLVIVDPILAATVTIVLGGAYALVFLATRRYLARIGQERVEANHGRFRSVNEALAGIKDVRVAGRENDVRERFVAPSLQFARFQAHNQIISSIPRYALEAIAFGSIVVIVLVLLSMGRGLSEVVPVLGVYAFAGYRLLPALQQLFAAATRIRFNIGSLEALDLSVPGGLRGMPNESDLPAKIHLPLEFERAITFDRVTYAYDSDEPPVLRDLSLTIAPRTTVAFVGPTGAGKTTAIDVLLGLLEPTSGSVQVDDVTLDSRTVRNWQAMVGYVPQTVFLTDDTIESNIAFGVPSEHIDRSAVFAAARLAQLDRFIETQLPDGYRTVVGERGIRLSGGQRQRLGIARALYADPEVLVLDEATSALDGATERALFDAIDSLAGSRTIVLIAHRIATVRSCEEIFVLDRGRLVARGTYEALYQASPLFRALADGSVREPDEPITRLEDTGSMRT